MIKFRIRSRSRLWLNLTASAAFIALAIYGWDLPVETAIVFLAICVLFLVAIIALGLVAGWVLRYLRNDEERDGKP